MSRHHHARAHLDMGSWLARALSLLFLASLGPLCACQQAGPPSNSYGVMVAAETNAGKPLPGVRLFADGQELGITGENGQFGIEIPGTDGDRLLLKAQCPEGYDKPKHRDVLVLQTFATLGAAPGGNSATRIDIVCHAQLRTTVVAVKADQPDVPIIHRGKMLARTNSRGVAHLQLTVGRDANFRLTLDTSHNPRMRPQSPSRKFDSPEEGWTVWNQPLEVLPEPPKPKKKVRRKQPPPPSPATPPPPKRQAPERLR